MVVERSNDREQDVFMDWRIIGGGWDLVSVKKKLRMKGKVGECPVQKGSNVHEEALCCVMGAMEVWEQAE